MAKPAAVAAATMLLLVGSFFCISGGGIGYFSPDTLQSASRSQWYVGDCRVYSTPVQYHEMPIVTYLVKKNFWQPANGANPRWIVSFQWRAGQRDGESRLHRELAWNHKAWIDWSEQHPDLARELWPLVLRILRTSGRWSNSSGYVAEALLFQGPRHLNSASDLHQLIAGIESEFGPLR